MKIILTQVTDQKHWAGLTKSNNLVAAGLVKGPAVLSQTIDNLYEMVNGDDNLVSVVDKYPTIYTDQEVYEWMLRGSSERNIPLVKATYEAPVGTEVDITSATTATIGANFQPFYLYFAEKWFSAPSVLGGLRPEDYLVIIKENPTQVGSLWRYKVTVYGNSNSLSMPIEELVSGVPYGQMFAPVEKDFSLRGSDIQFESFYKLQNTISYFSKSTEVPGSMIAMGKNIPLAYAFQDDKGKTQTAWIDKLGWEFYVQFRRDYARALLYGKSTIGADGSSNLFGESGNPLLQGYGLYEQMNGSNLGFYNIFNLDGFTDFLSAVSYNKLPEDSRKFLVTTGQFGAIQFHKAAQMKGATIPWLRSDVNFSDGGHTLDEKQIKKYIFLNGIEINIMIDPMLDSPITAGKMLHPQGGYVSSYIYNIWDFGTTQGEPNIAKVNIKGMEEYIKYLPGFRDPYSAGGLGQNMAMVASMKDGYEIRAMKIGSVRIKNPLKTGRYMPSIYKSLGY